MSTIKQNLYDTLVSVMTTELNSLANNARAISSAMGSDATTAAALWGDFILTWAEAATPTVDTTVDLFLVRCGDGTVYEDGDASKVPGQVTFVGSFQLLASSSTQVKIIPNVRVPPGLWKAVIYNNGTGKAFAASSNTLKFRPHNLQVV